MWSKKCCSIAWDKDSQIHGIECEPWIHRNIRTPYTINQIIATTTMIKSYVNLRHTTYHDMLCTYMKLKIYIYICVKQKYIYTWHVYLCEALCSLAHKHTTWAQLFDKPWLEIKSTTPQITAKRPQSTTIWLYDTTYSKHLGIYKVTSYILLYSTISCYYLSFYVFKFTLSPSFGRLQRAPGGQQKGQTFRQDTFRWASSIFSDLATGWSNRVSSSTLCGPYCSYLIILIILWNQQTSKSKVCESLWIYVVAWLAQHMPLSHFFWLQKAALVAVQNGRGCSCHLKPGSYLHLCNPQKTG